MGNYPFSSRTHSRGSRRYRCDEHGVEHCIRSRNRCNYPLCCELRNEENLERESLITPLDDFIRLNGAVDSSVSANVTPRHE